MNSSISDRLEDLIAKWKRDPRYFSCDFVSAADELRQTLDGEPLDQAASTDLVPEGQPTPPDPGKEPTPAEKKVVERLRSTHPAIAGPRHEAANKKHAHR